MRGEQQGAGGGRGGRPPRSLPLARTVLFAGTLLLLVVAALAAGAVGPWQSRPPTRVPLPVVTVTTASTTAASRPSAASTQPAPSSSNSQLLLWLLLCGVLLVLGFFLVRALAARRVPARAGAGARVGDALAVAVPEQPPPPPPAAAVGRSFDPRAAADAVISSWLWVEEWAASRQLDRRRHETPTEFLDRVVAATGPRSPAAGDGDPPSGATAPDGDRRAAAAAVLLPLYQRARFDVGLLTEDSALRARDAALVVCGRGRAAR